MKLKSGEVLAIFAALLLTRGALASELQPYEAVYETEMSGFDVKVKRRLQIQDNLITVSTDAKRFMIGVHETATLLDQGEGRLSSRTYTHSRKGLTDKHDKELVFDWEDDTVIDLLEPERAPLPVEEPSYDNKLGFQVQMRLDLIRDPEMKHAEYVVTNGVRNRTYTIDYLDEEVLDTSLGKLRTLKFKREGDDDERQVSMWVAPDWDFLLVRVDQTKEPGADTVSLILKNAKIAGRKVTGL